MDWLNIRIATLRAAEYIGSEPVQRATWLNVSAYCAEQENGGVMRGGAKLKDRQWQQACGVTLAEVQAAAPLLTIDGDDVHVWNYPVEKEQLVKAKREAGKVGGSSTSQAKTQAARDNGTKAKAKQNPSEHPTEGKGREVEGNTPKPPQAGDSDRREKLREQSREIGSWFNRKESTNWSDKEKKRLGKIGPLPADEMASMAAYYTAEIQDEENIRRRDVFTLLNNWPGEVDRARKFCRQNPDAAPAQAPAPPPAPRVDRSKFKAWLAEHYPRATAVHPSELDVTTRLEFEAYIAGEAAA